MKNLTNIIGLFLILTFSASTIFAQWETIHYPSDSIKIPCIHSLSFTDTNNGLAACGGTISYQFGGASSLVGTIIKTSNAGENWESIYTVDTAYFIGIVHTNPSTVICIGRKMFSNMGIIARSTDYGENWDTIMTPYTISAISFPSNNIGYACGYDGVLLKTTSGGENWDLIDLGLSNSFFDCLFLNDTVGFLTSNDTILKTTDGGINWNTQSISTVSPSPRITDISFPSLNIGYFMVRDQEITYIYKTNNNGDQWNCISIIDTGSVFATDMVFPTETIGYVCGQFQLHKTTDGGLTWYRQYSSPPASENFFDDLMSLYFFDKDTGYAGGSSQFYRTTNGGDSINGINVISYNNKPISIYPNPFSAETTIETHNLFKEASLIIYDLYGHKIKQENNINGKQFIFSRRNLSDGIYFFHIADKDESYSGRFIISNY